MKISPLNFISNIEHAHYQIALIDIFEGVCQGGPLLGKLYINNAHTFKKSSFGGPFMINNDVLYIPEITKSLLNGIGFRLVSVDLNSLKKSFVTSWEPLVLLVSITNDQVDYFIDLENSKKKSIII
jgi:hypothetical protein